MLINGKAVDVLSEASRCKLLKESNHKFDASECNKIFTFMTKLQPVPQSVEFPAENKQVSNSLIVDIVSLSISNTDSAET